MPQNAKQIPSLNSITTNEVDISLYYDLQLLYWQAFHFCSLLFPNKISATCNSILNIFPHYYLAQIIYLKLNVLSHERRLPLHLPQRSWRWGLLGSTWRSFTGQVHLVCLQLWNRQKQKSHTTSPTHPQNPFKIWKHDSINKQAFCINTIITGWSRLQPYDYRKCSFFLPYILNG